MNYQVGFHHTVCIADVSPHEWALLMMLAGSLDPADGYAHVTIRELAANTRANVDDVCTRLRSLAEKGLVCTYTDPSRGSRYRCYALPLCTVSPTEEEGLPTRQLPWSTRQERAPQALVLVPSKI